MCGKEGRGLEKIGEWTRVKRECDLLNFNNLFSLLLFKLPFLFPPSPEIHLAHSSQIHSPPTISRLFLFVFLPNTFFSPSFYKMVGKLEKVWTGMIPQSRLPPTSPPAPVTPLTCNRWAMRVLVAKFWFIALFLEFTYYGVVIVS